MSRGSPRFGRQAGRREPLFTFGALFGVTVMVKTLLFVTGVSFLFI